jgi:diadenylate cyclase
MESVGASILIKEFFTWQTMVDIFLMAAGLFFLYRTLLRLGTWRIVVGILAAMGLFLVARTLHLIGITWIFGNLSQVAAVALIVIFQPELRKFFERAVSMRRAETGDSEDEISRIVAEALWKLSQQRRGAIVVFPGKEPLEEWLSGGFKLDAKPSIPLIMSIFDPNSPGHDGAVIVQNGKFRRFGVRLPVSQSARLPEEYGTRHHAAMGLAEKSDALAIVVSEERGRVSVFNNGRMHPVNDYRQISAKIISHWKETGSYLIKLPDRKARWKVFSHLAASLVIAALFWTTLIMGQGEILEKIITVPVEYTAAPPKLILVGEKQKEARLHLAGPKSALDDVNAAQLSVKVDLSKAAAGKQTFPITGEHVRLPGDVSLLDVVPSGVELTLAEVEERELTIKPQLIGKLPGKMKILELKVIPEKVKVLSPAPVNVKSNAASVITTPIYLESIYNDTSIFCKIIASAGLQAADKRWPDVEVIIKVGY